MKLSTILPYAALVAAIVPQMTTSAQRAGLTPGEREILSKFEVQKGYVSGVHYPELDSVRVIGTLAPRNLWMTAGQDHPSYFFRRDSRAVIAVNSNVGGVYGSSNSIFVNSSGDYLAARDSLVVNSGSGDGGIHESTVLGSMLVGNASAINSTMIQSRASESFRDATLVGSQSNEVPILNVHAFGANVQYHPSGPSIDQVHLGEDPLSTPVLQFLHGVVQ